MISLISLALIVSIIPVLIKIYLFFDLKMWIFNNSKNVSRRVFYRRYLDTAAYVRNL